MATLTVRQFNRKDFLQLNRIRQREVDSGRPFQDYSRRSRLIRKLALGVPGRIRPVECVVALVDDELCAYLLLERHDDTYRWNVVFLAAGSPRVNATAEVTTELWVAVLEHGVQIAGAAGARRVFASALSGTPAYIALGHANFSPYTKHFTLCGQLEEQEGPGDIVVREQHPSDVWSIHQLYNRLTPRTVQYAEALTSDSWQLDSRSVIPGRGSSSRAFVVDTPDGIGLYCHIDCNRGRPLARFMCAPDFYPHSATAVSKALAMAGVSGTDVDLVIPAYGREYVSHFLDAGMWIESERVAMIRHTTVARVVHPAFTTVPVGNRSAQRSMPGISTFDAFNNETLRAG